MRKSMPKKQGNSKKNDAKTDLYLINLSCQRQMFRSGPLRMGYKRGCTFCWGAFGTLRENTIWLIENVIFGENCLKIWFCMIFSEKIWKNTKKEARIQQKWENGLPGWAKVSQRAPKVSQKGAKGSQKGAKGSQKAAKGSQKGAKGEPTGDQNASKSRPSEKVAKKGAKKGAPGFIFGAILEPFSVKNRWKNRCKNRCRKSHENIRKSMPKLHQNLVENPSKIWSPAEEA